MRKEFDTFFLEETLIEHIYSKLSMPETGPNISNLPADFLRKARFSTSELAKANYLSLRLS